MSMALGLPCRDGLLICADEEVQGPSGNKSYEERISCVDLYGSVLVSSYAGAPELWKEATDKITHQLIGLQGPEEEGDVCVTPHAIYETADEVFTAMGRPANLQMLMAVGGVFNSPELFVFERGAMRRTGGFVLLGGGESSMVRYLADNLYSPSISMEMAKSLGIYLIAKAAQYMGGVGAPIDVVVVAGHQPEWLGDKEIKERESIMLAREKTFLPQILTPRSSATRP
jgi:20S proteasome alpha/beta subunit